MMFGAYLRAQDGKKPEFYAGEPKDEKADKQSQNLADQSSANTTAQNFLTQPEDSLKNDDTPQGQTSFERAQDAVHEYNIVKQMLINNSLPISEGKLDTQKESVFARMLIIDKKILLNLLIDLQRFRKTLNLKKSFYIFHVEYDGKPPEHAKWHREVDRRVTQTFRQLNIRRLIDIIGYDPSQYFKGELRNEDLKEIGKGNLPTRGQQRGAGAQRLNSRGAPSFPSKKDPTASNSKLDKLEDMYRHENLSQNLSQVVSKYDVASRQIKEMIDLLRKVNVSKE